LIPTLETNRDETRDSARPRWPAGTLESGPESSDNLLTVKKDVFFITEAIINYASVFTSGHFFRIVEYNSLKGDYGPML
jgi:hypothetical protein